jgi:murein L,D-transpeptidase YcbB/YkuD
VRAAAGFVAVVLTVAACQASDDHAQAGSAIAPASAPAPAPLDLSAAITAQGCTPGGQASGRTAAACAQLDSLYAQNATPLWLTAEGRPTGDADQAVALLAASADHGLTPGDYHADVLTRLAEQVRRPDGTAEARARFEVDLTLNLLRYWRHLHEGRVDPRTLGFRLPARRDEHDFPAMLRAAAGGHDLGAATAKLQPPFALYRGLVGQLRRYRELAGAAAPLTLPIPARSIKPGETADGLAGLRARLELLGDLPTGSPPVADGETRYEGPLVDGVKHFQERHGLDPDGALGPATLAALRVPLATRVEQLELALERLRWLPHLRPEGFLAVNIPMFRLWGWGPVPPDGSPAFDMNVIVGRALNTQTPPLVEELRYIIFRPYWNVPTSILRGEILPALARNPAYLARNDMEIVAGPGDNARVVELSDDALEGLRRGTLRVRQRPGPRNSLGLVKFVFPNDDNVYLHGTPSVQLFGRARRDFSHGCVRVEDPVALAEWLLRDQPAWTRERIVAAMEGAAPLRVNLTQPLQVVLFYLTAVVIPQDGTVHFAEDVYGFDAKLRQALQRRGA